MEKYSLIYKAFVSGKMSLFYDEMFPGLLRYTAGILGDELAYLAEDVLQDAILATYVNRHILDTPERWRAWLYTGIRNRAVEMIRKANSSKNYLKHTSVISDDVDPASIEADIIEQETMDAFFDAVRSLPEKYRSIVELSFEKGLKNAEVAQMLSITEVAVRKRKARLIEIMREKLGGTADATTIIFLLSNYIVD